MTVREFREGDVVVHRRTFRSHDFNAFASVSGDRSPLHHDADYAALTRFGEPIVPALLAAGPLSAAAGMALPGHRALILGIEVQALEPVLYDEEVTYSFRVNRVSEGTQTLEVRALALQRGRVVLEGRLRIRVRDDVSPDSASVPAWGSYLSAGSTRRAVVTGAGGAIGAACARALADRGWHLTLQHRPGDPRPKALASQLGRAVEVELLPADLGEAEGRRAVATALRESPPTALVHAASPPVEAPAAELHEVNYGGLKSLLDGALPGMLERQEGVLVTIGSEAVRTVPPGWEDYAAAKLAAGGLSAAIARRHRARGISATVVHPTFVAGSFSSAYRPDDVVPLLPEEVAELVVGVIDGDHPGALELWLRPGVVEGGSSAGESAPPPEADVRPSRSGGGGEGGHAGGSGGRLEQEVERIAREVLRLDDSLDMSQAALGTIENWTSLAQIEMLLALEERFGIAFASADLSGAPSLSELKALVAQKVS